MVAGTLYLFDSLSLGKNLSISSSHFSISARYYSIQRNNDTTRLIFVTTSEYLKFDAKCNRTYEVRILCSLVHDTGRCSEYFKLRGFKYKRMDVILSPSSIKIFTSSIVCFSRIAGSSNAGGGGGNSSTSQQDIYWEFDPITGLTIRTMNDAKTAYACISYQPNFFNYCSTNTNTITSQRHSDVMDNTSQQTCSQNTTTSNSSGSTTTNTKRQRKDNTFTCRVTIKALIPIVRHRNNKTVESLRIRSYYDDASDHSRRGVPVATTNATTLSNHQMHQSQPLGLEFIFTLRNDKNDPNQYYPHQYPNGRNNGHNTNNYQRLVIHRIPVVDSAPTTATTSSPSLFGNVMNPMMYQDKEEPPSELIVSPYVLSRLLEPLQRTVEVALIVRSHTSTNHDHDEVETFGGNAGMHHIPHSVGSVSASSFHHSDTTYDPSIINNNNAILQATTASLLKTETACTSQEFVDFDLITTRHNHRNGNDMPENVNEEVILVFPIKEAKAMLQFCCSTSMTSSALQPHPSENQLVHVSFHWGGQPFMIQTYNNNTNDTTANDDHQDNNAAFMSSPQSSYNMQLVLATMDYQLLTSMRTTTAHSAQQ